MSPATRQIAHWFVAGALLVLLSLGGRSVVSAQNWPQWRGEKFDSLAPDQELPVEFSADKNLAWKFSMPGPGGSTPVVWDGTVFVTTADESGDDLFLLAIGPDGQQIWRRPLGGKNREIRMDNANLASPSPITDGQHVWATTGAGVLSCFDMAGEPVWELDLQEKYGQFDIQFGMSTTPIRVDDRLYMQLIHGAMRSSDPGFGMVIALEASTGDVVWEQKRETDAVAENKHSYASPVLYEDSRQRFLLTHGGDFLIAHALEDGHELWRCAGLNAKENYNNFLRFVSSPAAQPGLIVAPSAKTGRVLALKPDGSGDITDDEQHQHWMKPRGSPDVATPVIYDGMVFLFREDGIVACLDATTGDLVWEKRLLADRHRSTPVVANGNFYITGRDGTVTVLKAAREPEVLASNSLGETTTASPAIAGGRLYVRTFENLYCFSLPQPPSPPPAGK